MIEKICEDCGKGFEVKNYGYKRKYPYKCQTCARKFDRSKMSKPIHGHRSNGKRDKLYTKWVQMRTACYTKTSRDYKHCGALGLTVSKKWNTYPKFKKWAEYRNYKDGMMLKRLDHNKGFEPDNCEFIKKRANRIFKYDNVVHNTESLHKVLRATVPLKTVQDRLSKHWTVGDAILNPFGFKIGKFKRKKISQGVVNDKRKGPTFCTGNTGGNINPNA